MEDSYLLIRRLMLATTKIDGAYYFFAKKLGIKENMLALLYALDDGKPHTQKQICDDWLIPKTTINTNIKELIHSGHIALLPGERRREKLIILTEKGKVFTREMLKPVYEAEYQALRKTLDQFSPDFAEALDCFADRICEEFEKIPTCGKDHL